MGEVVIAAAILSEILLQDIVSIALILLINPTFAMLQTKILFLMQSIVEVFKDFQCVS